MDFTDAMRNIRRHVPTGPGRTLGRWLAAGTALAVILACAPADPARAATLASGPSVETTLPGGTGPVGSVALPAPIELGGALLGAPAIPPAHKPYVEHATVLEVGDIVYTIVKLSYDAKSFEELAFDASGKSYPAAEIRDAYVAQFKRFGKIHPTLHAAIERLPASIHSVMLWLDVAPMPLLERPTELPAKFATVIAGLEAKHAEHLAAYATAKLEVLKKVALTAKELREDRSGSPFVIASLSVARIRELAQKAGVRMLLLHDAKGRDDLAAAIDVANADTVINTGIDGERIKVAVWEDCPDDTSDLVVEASFSTSEGIACTSSDHSRHVTGIIRNSTAIDGFAPASTVFSADRKTLAALDWAIDEQRVSAVNQSFHRAAEIGDGLQTDDLYKDYKVLQYPWPTIVHAAGNWCAAGSGCFEGGNDVLDEFVNHKGFNTISIGNHNDSASEMSASSCFVNPTSPHSDRELPELSANGTTVDAVGLTKSGTSMASPAVTGSVALLQDARSILRFWPEGNRALLLAGASINVATHAGQASEGGAAADAPNTWWRDVSLGNDGFDGAGALNVERSREIARNRYSGKALVRGFDLGTLRAASSFGSDGFATKTWKVQVPWFSFGTHVKVALAWNSTATVDTSAPEEIFASTLGMDLDVKIFDSKGKLVALSQSWDNSYEIAEFNGVWGETYTIKVRRFSAEPGAWTWFGIAWDLQ